MKRYVCLFLFLFTVLGLRAQVAEAMEWGQRKSYGDTMNKSITFAT